MEKSAPGNVALTLDSKSDLQMISSILYFKHVFNTGTSKSKLLVTPFHTAISRNLYSFVKKILDEIDDVNLKKFVLNANIEYKYPALSRTLPDSLYLTRIENLLSQSDRKILLPETHSLENIRLVSSYVTTGNRFEKSLFLAFSTGDTDLIELLLSHGAEYQDVDSKGDNIIHSLVHLSNDLPERATSMYKYLLNQNLDILKSLLHQRNNSGLKPVELAASLGLSEMTGTIINTKNIYRWVISRCGVVNVVRYDVTDYESEDSKCHKSILYYLTEMDEIQLKRANKCGLLLKEPFETWTNRKIQEYARTIAFFVVFWLIFVSSYYLQLLSFYGKKENNTFALTILFSCSICVVIPEILHMKDNLREIKHTFFNYWGGRIPVTFIFPHRIFQLIFATTSIFIVFNSISKDKDCKNYSRVLYVINAISAALSMLFFLQLLKGMGHSIILLQKMLYDTVVFLAMAFMIYFGFAVSFYMLQHPNLNCNRKNVTNTDCCKPQDMFQEFFQSLYETYLLMLTVMAPYDIYFRSSSLAPFSVLLYMICVMTIGVVMVNLMIAIMTRRLEAIEQTKESLLKLEKIVIVLHLQERANTKFWRFVRKSASAIINKIFRKIMNKRITEKFRRLKVDEVFTRSGSNVYLDVIENSFYED